ncbi:MAG: TrkA C-terminal domain-containing protein, partial [Candidatus Delongbacteria bacterium]
NIRNIAITPIMNELRDIDYVFSTESLALSEILNYFRKGDILSVYPIPDLKAETMKIKITNEIPILDIPLKDLKFPKGVIVGAILRNKKTIIPHGNDDIRKNDLVILFLLPSAAKQVEAMFSQNSF